VARSNSHHVARSNSHALDDVARNIKRQMTWRAVSVGRCMTWRAVFRSTGYGSQMADWDQPAPPYRDGRAPPIGPLLPYPVAAAAGAGGCGVAAHVVVEKTVVVVVVVVVAAIRRVGGRVGVVLVAMHAGAESPKV